MTSLARKKRADLKTALLVSGLGFYSLMAFAASNAVDSVDYSQLTDQVLVKVNFREPLTALPSNFTVASPPRIAFDFPDTENSSGKTTILANVGPLKGLNVVQSDVRTRLVLNLNSPNAFDTRIEGNALFISLPAKAATTEVAAKSAINNASAQAAANKVTPGTNPTPLMNGLDFRAESMDLATVKIDLSDPNVVIDTRQQGNELTLTLPDTLPVEKLIKRLDVRDFGTPIEAITVNKQGRGTIVKLSTRGEWDYNLRQLDTQAILEIRRSVRDPNSLVGSKDMQGKVVSFNFTQPVPVAQMIGIFQDITGLNFMVMPGVAGEIQSLKMDNTPIDEAITVISRMYGLGFRRYGSIVVVGKADDLVRYDKDERERAAAIAQAEPIQQETFRIKYRTASEIATALQKNSSATGNAGGGAASANTKERALISDRGMLTVDDATNTIYVEETKSQLAKIRERIQAMDRPAKQVMIEARIVEASSNFFESLGVNLSGSIRYSMNGNNDTVTYTTSNSATTKPTSTGTLNFSLYDNKQTTVVKLALTAAEGDGLTKQLANPKILTRDTQKATLKFGTKIAGYSQATAGATPSVTYTDAVTLLDVKPQVQLDGKIQMQITVKNDSPSGTSGNINNREVTTNVIVENGGSIVIGGMYKQDEVSATDRVPFFGDLPYVGWLFKTRTVTKSQSELLVFITPRVVSEELTVR